MCPMALALIESFHMNDVSCYYHSASITCFACDSTKTMQRYHGGIRLLSWLSKASDMNEKEKESGTRKEEKT